MLILFKSDDFIRFRSELILLRDWFPNWDLSKYLCRLLNMFVHDLYLYLCVYLYHEGQKMEIQYTIIKCHIEKRHFDQSIQFHKSHTVFYSFQFLDDTLDLGWVDPRISRIRLPVPLTLTQRCFNLKMFVSQ